MSLSCVNQALQNSVSTDEGIFDQINFDQVNQQLEAMTAEKRLEWSFKNLTGEHVLTSSFGAQSAVSLHLFQQVAPSIPVVVIDTGYLFKETYQFIDQLSQRLKLNLKVYRSPLSAAWQESRFGRLWQQGVEGIDQYNQLNKVEPLQRALNDLNAGTWYAGIRREQAKTRQNITILREQQSRFKMHPIADWSSKDLHFYLKKHNLPYHPLWEKGYVSIGDVHTTRPITEAMNEEDTRFFGLKRECGIHDL